MTKFELRYPLPQDEKRHHDNMQQFRFHDLRAFHGQSVSIKRPRELAEFSYDDEHVQHLDSRSLRYYYPPFFKMPYGPQNNTVDLNKGFESFKKYEDDGEAGLKPLLETLMKYEAETKTKLNPTIVTWRGMMTKILSAPFDMFGEFKMNATCFDGTVYIEEDHENKRAERSVKSGPARGDHGGQSQSLMEYRGYKFETIATIARPWGETSRDEIENRESDVVNNHAQYCSIVYTGIGEHRIVIGGEVDAVLGCKPDNPEQQIPYVELKTSEDFHPQDQRSAIKFERKLCRFWAQSFLLGVPKIIVGFRSKAGVLQRIEEWNTLDIPKMVKQNGQTWDAWVCISFASMFLDFLKEHITGDGSWTIEREKGRSEITLSRTAEDQSEKIVFPNFREHRQRAAFEKNFFDAT